MRNEVQKNIKKKKKKNVFSIDIFGVTSKNDALPTKYDSKQTVVR